MNNRRQGPRDASTAQLARQRPVAALVVLDPPADGGRSVVVKPDGLAIGRARSSGLVLSDPAASRTHAVVHAHGGEFVVEDRHSLNGTFLNGERITTPRALHDGDQLRFGRLVAEFRLVDQPSDQPGNAPGPDPRWDPDAPTAPSPKTSTLRGELREAPGFSYGALALAVLGSVVGTVLVAAIQDVTDQNPNWRLLGAALGPIISTTFTTRQAGEKGRVRAASIAMLSSVALVVSLSGFTIGDEVKGSPVLPGAAHSLPLPGISSDGGGGVRGPGPDPQNGAPEVLAPDEHDCGVATVDGLVPCDLIIVRNIGDARLETRTVEIQGTHREDFDADRGCTDTGLEPDEACQIVLSFSPTDEGPREALLVIGHTGPGGQTEVSLTGVGNAGAEPDPASGQDGEDPGR